MIIECVRLLTFILEILAKSELEIPNKGVCWNLNTCFCQLKTGLLLFVIVWSACLQVEWVTADTEYCCSRCFFRQKIWSHYTCYSKSPMVTGWIVFFKIFLFIDEARHGMAPSCLSDMLRYRMSTRQLRSPACAELSRSESNLHQVFWWSRVFSCRLETVEPASIDYKTI